MEEIPKRFTEKDKLLNKVLQCSFSFGFLHFKGAVSLRWILRFLRGDNSRSKSLLFLSQQLEYLEVNNILKTFFFAFQLISPAEDYTFTM